MPWISLAGSGCSVTKTCAENVINSGLTPNGTDVISGELGMMGTGPLVCFRTLRRLLDPPPPLDPCLHFFFLLPMLTLCSPTRHASTIRVTKAVHASANTSAVLRFVGPGIYFPPEWKGLRSYVTSMTGWFVPPFTGEYRFVVWVEGEGAATVRLSTDENAANEQEVGFSA